MVPEALAAVALAEPVQAAASSGGHGGADFTALGILLAGLFIVPILARAVRLPVVVAEILFGVALGDSGFGLIGDPEWLSGLSELGLIFLMFIAGLELNPRDLMGKYRGDALISVLVYAFSLVLGVVAMLVLQLPIFLALIISATGVGVVMPVLRELGLGGSRFGRVILFSSLVSEFATLLIVVVYDVVAKYGYGPRLLGLVVVGLFLAFTLVLLRALIWWYPKRFRVLFEEHDPSETGMRFSLFLVAAFVGVAVAVGLEHIVGSFLAGITLSLLFPDRRILDQKFLALGFGFLIPLFFVYVGLRFHLPDLGSAPVRNTFLLLLLVSYGVRGLASLVLLFVGFTPRETLAGGLLVATQLSLNIVAGAIALRLGLITEDLYASVILLALVTSSIFPTIAKALLEHAIGARKRAEALLEIPAVDHGEITTWEPGEE